MSSGSNNPEIRCISLPFRDEGDQGSVTKEESEEDLQPVVIVETKEKSFRLNARPVIGFLLEDVTRTEGREGRRGAGQELEEEGKDLRWRSSINLMQRSLKNSISLAVGHRAEGEEVQCSRLRVIRSMCLGNKIIILQNSETCGEV
jgi:hypothetical protein